MKTPKHSLRKIVTFLNNTDEDGGFWLPNIQRPFVWSEDQICRMFDSIMREYPIGTLLVWKTNANVRRRKFIDNFKRSMLERLSEFNVPDDEKKKCLVLDGQQRLQSLYIGLKGSFEGKELYLDILSGELAAPDDVKYKFKFESPSKASFPWIKFKDIVFDSRNLLALANHYIRSAGRDLTALECDKVSAHVAQAFRTFRDDDGIAYQELDSIENEELYKVDDVVEVFIRANSGGTKLGKSDLLFSLLASGWEDASDNMEELLNQLRAKGYSLPRDFVLKTCLSLLGQGASYDVAKFHKPGVREQIEEKWEDISAAIRDVIDFLQKKTFIRTDKALLSNMVLIPLVYLRYYFPEAWKKSKYVDQYLLQSLLSGVFGTYADQLIDDTVAKIDLRRGFDIDEMFGVIRSKGKTLEIPENRFWQMGYGSDTIHLIFNLWYRDFDYHPAYENNHPQVDHIFPQSALKRVKAPNPKTSTMNKMKYKEADRNQLANCMLLTREENGSGGKGDTLPDIWFADKDPEYLKRHEIPTNPALWKLDRFEEFIAARKALIRDRFKVYLLQQTLPES